MRYSTLAVQLSLLGAVRAGPRLRHAFPQPRTTPSIPSDEFTLAITVNNTYIPLKAVSNGTDLLVLQADTLSAQTGTPAYSNQTANTGTGYNTSLVLDLANITTTAYPAGHYGLSVPDLGDVYGATSNVVAQIDYQDFGFQIDDEAIYHALTSASQSWFACLDSVDNGTQSYFLKWGVFTAGGSVPTGCLVTNVVQVF